MGLGVSVGNTAQNIILSRLVGRGKSNHAVSIIVPSADQLSSFSENNPVVIILAALNSVKDIGANRILDVALERMAELFYEDKERSVLKRMERIAGAAQHILAELFFKAGYEGKPFKVTLDLGMLSLLDGVYTVYVDGKIRVWVIKKDKAVEITKVYSMEGDERLKGSGRWSLGDKLIMATNETARTDWLIDQLKAGVLSQESIVKSLGLLTVGEGVIVIGLGVGSKLSPAEAVMAQDLNLIRSETSANVNEGSNKEGDRVTKKEGVPISSISVEKPVGYGATRKVPFLVAPSEFFSEKIKSLKNLPFLNKLLSKHSGVGSEIRRERIKVGQKIPRKREKEASESDSMMVDDEKRPTTGLETVQPHLETVQGRRWVFKRSGVTTIRDWAKSIGFLFSHVLGYFTPVWRRRRRIIKTDRSERKQLLKGIIGLLIVGILCFLIWIFISKAFNERKNRENYKKQVSAIDTSVKWIEDHKSDASFTIEDRLNKVNEVRASIAALKSNPLAEQSNIENWILRLQNVEDFLTKTIPITHVDVLSDLNIQYSSSNPVDIDVKGDEVFVLDAASKRVYTVNLLTKGIDVYAECATCNGLEKIAWSKSHLFVYDSQKGLFDVLTDKSFNSVAGISAFGTSVTELSTYFDNIYFLLQEKRVIIKSTALKGGYSLGQEYNKSLLPTGSEDMAINGYIFVCTSAGEIKKYELGEEVPFHISGLRTPVGPKCSIDTLVPETETEKNYIYLLDSLNKRIVVINKDDFNGNPFIAQMVYRGDQMWFKNIKEIALTDDGKSLILLDGSAVLRIDLTPVFNTVF